MSYLLIILISLFTLTTIGLRPLYIILKTPDVGLAGIYVVLFSWVLWIMGFFVSLISYLLLRKLFRLKAVPLGKILLIAFFINLIGAFSIEPGYSTLISVRNSVRDYFVSKDFNFEVNLIDEKIIPSSIADSEYSYAYKSEYAYVYKIIINNKSNKTFENIPTRVLIGFHAKDYIMNFLSISSPIYNNFEKRTYPPGQTIIEGEQLLQFTPFGEVFKKKYPVQINVWFILTGTENKQYYLDSKIPNIQNFVYSEIEKQRVILNKTNH